MFGMDFLQSAVSSRQRIRFKTHLTSIKTEASQEAAASLGQILHDDSLDVDLELEQVDILPVGAVQGEDVPGFADLGRAAQRHHVQVGEDSEEQLLGQHLVNWSIVKDI